MDMSTLYHRGTEDDLARTAEILAASFASSFVTPLRAASASVCLRGVQYVSIVVPASSGQVISVANLATTGPLHMTLLHSSQCAAGHTLQHRWAFTSYLFSHFKDIQAFPEAAGAAALMCHPLLERPPDDASRLLRANSAPDLLHRLDDVPERTISTPPRLGGVQQKPSFKMDSPGRIERIQAQRHGKQAEDPAKPPVIGALVLGLDRSKPPQKRDMEKLASLLGPLIAPLAGRAVDVASAAYLARTLSRQPPEALPPGTELPDQAAAASDSESTSASGSSAGGMRRAATDSWILSIGERVLLQQLLDNASLTQRSISALPWRGDSSPMMSPLMSSMDVASRRDSTSAKFTFTLSMPLAPPTGSQRAEGSMGSHQRSFSAGRSSSIRSSASRTQPLSPVREPEGGFFAHSDSYSAATFGTSPARTVFLTAEHPASAAERRIVVNNPFAGAADSTEGGSAPGQPPPPAWGLATAAQWGHPAPVLATLKEGNSPTAATEDPPQQPTAD